MTIQHNAIADPNIHEPKGVAIAPVGTTYLANGLGSGAWDKVNSASLRGISGDGGNSNLKLVSDGANGFVFRTNAAYGAATITNNGTPFVVAAAADPTLQATADYVLFSGVGAPWVGENNFGIVFDGTDRLTVPVTGVYMLNAYANISGYPNVNAFVGARFRINGSTFTARTSVTKSNSAGDQGNLVGAGLFAASAGDFFQLFVASSHAGNLTIRNFVVTFQLVRQTA